MISRISRNFSREMGHNFSHLARNQNREKCAGLKKDTLKIMSLGLPRYDVNVPLKNLNLCQNLERVVLAKWHSKHLEMLTGIPNLKNLVLLELDAKVDTLVTFFQRLSLKKVEILFKRGASKAAEGCLASVAAKLVKTAKEIPFQETCAWK